MNLLTCINQVLSEDLGEARNVNTEINVEEAQSFTYLICENFSIEHLTGLESFINLNDLDLSANYLIQDITALAGLTNLYSLSLDENNLNDITALTGLINLTYLDLSNNKIKDVAQFAKLTSLQYLSLNKNNISDIKLLAELSENGSLIDARNQTINLNDINVSTKQTNIVINFTGNNESLKIVEGDESGVAFGNGYWLFIAADKYRLAWSSGNFSGVISQKAV